MAYLLTIGFSALADRVGNITWPDHQSDVDVVVCVQGGAPDTVPPTARTVIVEGVGVAKSRNAAIQAADSQFLLFCDDDVEIDMAGVRAGIEHLRRTGHALALGRGVDPSGALRKSYPSATTRLTKFNSARAATYEMLIDVGQIRAAGVTFDERFGAGTTLHLADEYVFIVDLLRAGLVGDAVPEVFGTHPEVSSGDRWTSPNDRHVRAVALNRVFGRAALLARIGFALKNRRNLGGVRNVFDFVGDRSAPPELGSNSVHGPRHRTAAD